MSPRRHKDTKLYLQGFQKSASANQEVVIQSLKSALLVDSISIIRSAPYAMAGVW